MSAVTLEAVKAKQTELAKLIEQLQAHPAGQPTTIQIEALTISLAPGERYAGARLDPQGNHLHHVIVLAERRKESQDWKSALKWGAKFGDGVAAPEEYALIKANCPDLLTESWYWTNKEYEDDASFAWFFLSDGDTYGYRKSSAGGALAVRRV